MCSHFPISSTVFIKKPFGSLTIFYILHSLSIFRVVGVCAAQTGSRASRQLIQSYPNSATSWVANMSALPHNHFSVGLINGTHSDERCTDFLTYKTRWLAEITSFLCQNGFLITYRLHSSQIKGCQPARTDTRRGSTLKAHQKR